MIGTKIMQKVLVQYNLVIGLNIAECVNNEQFFFVLCEKKDVYISQQYFEKTAGKLLIKIEIFSLFHVKKTYFFLFK